MEFHKGPLLFLIYINDFPLSVKKIGNPILFADDTSIISNTNPEEFKNNIKLVLNETIMWFNSKFLTLNCDKSHLIQFFLKKHREIELQIISNNSIITNITCTKFLGINVDSTLSWKNHITDLSSWLNTACYAIRAIKPFMSPESMMIYYSYVHSLLSYGIGVMPLIMRVSSKLKNNNKQHSTHINYTSNNKNTSPKGIDDNSTIKEDQTQSILVHEQIP